MRAFSLVELSIVLVILGLLTGGILAGQSLIRAAEVRAITTEYQRYVTATQSFRDKYMGIPGDFASATRFWGRYSTTSCTTRSSAAVTSPGTCDGNGDGVVLFTLPNISSEMYQYWNQLALSGLIEGSYTGLGGPGSNYDSIIGQNVPASRLGNAGWTVYGMSSVFVGTGSMYGGINYGNYFIYGADNPTEETDDAVLRPEEAWNIDTKIDDGTPARGKVLARFWNDQCATPNDGVTFTNTNYDASYKLSSTSIACALYFPRAF